MKNRILIAAVFMLLTLAGWSNVAEPGVWSSGGTGNYTLLFPGDSSYYRKIQMQKETVIIQLYPGFAVVNGKYQMYNTTDDTIVMNAGYPVNSGFEPDHNYRHGKLNIDFSDLYALRVSTNNIKREFSRNTIEKNSPDSYGSKQDWYTWQDTFLPQTTTLIDISFIVNTNESSMLDGYEHAHDNVFVYLLESGASWKPPIGEGDFFVELMEGVGPDNIRGIAPDSIFHLTANKKILHYHFRDFIPDEYRNNIVIAYGKQVENFHFEKIVADADKYFSRLNHSYPVGNEQVLHTDDPYNFGTKVGNAIFGLAVFSLLGILGLIVLVVLLIRKSKRKAS